MSHFAILDALRTANSHLDIRDLHRITWRRFFVPLALCRWPSLSTHWAKRPSHSRTFNTIDNMVPYRIRHDTVRTKQPDHYCFCFSFYIIVFGIYGNYYRGQATSNVMTTFYGTSLEIGHRIAGRRALAEELYGIGLDWHLRDDRVEDVFTANTAWPLDKVRVLCF